MANIVNQRLSAEITDAELAEVKHYLAKIGNLLPFLTGLTVTERMELPKISVANKIFVEDVVTVANNNPHLVPNFISAPEMKKDLALYKQLDDILTEVNQLQEKLRDTQMLAGSEAYSSSLMTYKMIGMGADAGVPGADSLYDQLKQRFAGQGSSNTSNNNL